MAFWSMGRSRRLLQMLPQRWKSTRGPSLQDGRFPLITAAKTGNVQKVLELLDLDGIDVKQVEEKTGSFPLHAAAAGVT